MANQAAAPRGVLVNEYMAGFSEAVAGWAMDRSHMVDSAYGQGHERGRRILREAAIAAGRYATELLKPLPLGPSQPPP
jgi:hypothetical protein